MYSKKVKGYNQERAEELVEQKAKALESGDGDFKPRVKLAPGHNVFMWLPSLSEPDPYAHKLVHYNPFHLCSRAAPVPYTNGKEGFHEDKKFANCPRCDEAWKTWAATADENGERDRGAPLGKFKSDMSSHQVMIQVVNLTPFFNDGSPFVKVNKDLINDWFEPFVTLLKAGMQGEDPEVPEGMPEDIRDAALAGIDCVLLNKDTGVNLARVYQEKYFNLEEEDPLFMPDKFLLQIKKTKSADKKFEVTNADGTKREMTGYTYAPSFAPVSSKKGWPAPKSLMDVINEMIESDKLVDIHNPSVDDEAELEDKARALVPLSGQEIEDLLSMNGHSYHIIAAEPQSDEDSEGDEDFSSGEMKDPDEMELASPLDNDQSEKLKEIAARING